MKKSAKAAKNRNTIKEGSVTKHTAGSCSFVKHKHKMEKYDTTLKEKHGNDSSSQVIFDDDAWKCVIGDINALICMVLELLRTKEQLPSMLSSLGYHPMDNVFGDNVPPSSSSDIPNISQNDSQGTENHAISSDKQPSLDDDSDNSVQVQCAMLLQLAVHPHQERSEGNSGSASLEMSCCNAKIANAVASTGSTLEWGAAACPPFPSIFTSKTDTAAKNGPGMLDIVPVGFV
nr:Transposase, Ptta/En/Spm, plant [Ipomoea batatas]